jgi:hypothetical protein
MRWSEEVLLLREEMRRTLAFLEWHATWWETRGTLHTKWWEDQDNSLTNPQHDPAGLRRPTIEDAEGMAAYTHKQAHIRRTIRSSFNHLWRGAVKFMEVGLGADNDILGLDLAPRSSLLDLPVMAPSL